MEIIVEFFFADHTLRVYADYDEGEDEVGLYPSYLIEAVELKLGKNNYLDITGIVDKLAFDADSLVEATRQAYIEEDL